MYFESVTLFRPDLIDRKQSTLPAEIFNRIRLLFNRAELECQFVPIRSMQYQAVITEDEVIFVDSQGYAVHDGEGGRMIVVAWQFERGQKRDSLSEPVKMDIITYHHDTRELERRLIGEFNQAMKQLLDRQLETSFAEQCIKVVPISG